MQDLEQVTRGLLDRLRTYSLPGGEAAVRGVRGIRTTQRGEIRMGPAARWNSFTADEFVDATSSAFCWEARIGSNLLTSVNVTDAYEGGRGQLVLRKGLIPLKKMLGPEVDGGELQRYLGYIPYCPAMLLNHSSLELRAVGPRTLRVRDRESTSHVTVDYDIAEDGRPILIRCVRSKVEGGRVIPTPWSASGRDPGEWEGMRIARHMEACWDAPEGSFPYIRIELASVTVLR